MGTRQAHRLRITTAMVPQRPLTETRMATLSAVRRLTMTATDIRRLPIAMHTEILLVLRKAIRTAMVIPLARITILTEEVRVPRTAIQTVLGTDLLHIIMYTVRASAHRRAIRIRLGIPLPCSAATIVEQVSGVGKHKR